MGKTKTKEKVTFRANIMERIELSMNKSLRKIDCWLASSFRFHPFSSERDGHDVYEILLITRLIAKYLKNIQITGVTPVGIAADADGDSDNMWTLITMFQTLQPSPSFSTDTPVCSVTGAELIDCANLEKRAWVTFYPKKRHVRRFHLETTKTRDKNSRFKKAKRDAKQS